MYTQSPCLLENAITSTPAQSSVTRGIPTLTKLQDKMKPGATLLQNYVFSSKGTLTYESLDIPDFIYGYLEFYKAQSSTCKQALLMHLQPLMERAATYICPSVRSFHLAIATAVERGRLSWTSSEAIRKRAQTFFSHQDLRTQPHQTGSQCQNSQPLLPHGNRAQKESLCRDWNYMGNVPALLLAPLLAPLIDVEFATQATIQCYTAPSADLQSQLLHHQELTKIKQRID